MKYVFDQSKLDDVIRTAYALSAPQGLGFLHVRDGELDDEMLAEIKKHSGNRHGAIMDYVHGRAVKMAIRREDDGTYSISADRWFDHSLSQLKTLAGYCELGEPVGEV